tara:strand:+ start:176 stop:373 length:198 start_codon:yes stop_codon:yes gene_type:complete
VVAVVMEVSQEEMVEPEVVVVIKTNLVVLVTHRVQPHLKVQMEVLRVWQRLVILLLVVEVEGLME